jgi:hypothetical protein
MDPGGDEEMSIIVRITVEHDDGVGAAEHQNVLAILGVVEGVAEEATPRGCRQRGTLVDVLRTPGGPDPIQHDA